MLSVSREALFMSPDIIQFQPMYRTRIEISGLLTTWKLVA